MNRRGRYYVALAVVLTLASLWYGPAHPTPLSPPQTTSATGSPPASPAEAVYKGDPLTIIQRPLLNIPAIVRPGDVLEISCEADPLTTGWTARLRFGAMSVPLGILNSVYDPSTTWWTVRTSVPVVPLHELYDLIVTADGGLSDRTENAVKVIPAFRDDYYFIHITDTHLPTSLYYYEPGSDTDISELLDLREVMNDIDIINPEFVFLTGDLVNEGELEEFLDRRYYTRAQRALSDFRVPLYLTAGNHDIGGWTSTPPPDGTARRTWWRFFGWNRLENPPPGAPWYTQNYSFDYGPVHYTALESYVNYDSWRYSIYGPDSFTSGQMQWLASDLASAAGSTSQVLVYHYDFSDQIDLNNLGLEMTLAGHTHQDGGNIHSPPYDLTTDNVSHGDRAYRLIRVSNGILQPASTLTAGAYLLHVFFTPANIGHHSQVTGRIVNGLNERFEHGQLRFRMPKGAASAQVTGGTIVQVDTSGSVDVYYVAVDILAGSTQLVTVTVQ